MYPAHQSTFLPLTVAAARSAALAATEPPFRSGAQAVRRHAEEANDAAAECWVALLGGCSSPGRRNLPTRLRELSDATSVYVETGWTARHLTTYRRKLAEAQSRIDDAVREGDGAEFAEAFIGYDQVVATAVVSARSRMESPA